MPWEQENLLEYTEPRLHHYYRPSPSLSSESWGAASRDEWLRLVRNRLKKLTDLPNGWDGYGAPRVTVDTTLFAFQILRDLWKPKLPTPDISPMSSGGIMVEWLRDERELTVEVLAPYCTRYLFEEGEEEEDGDVGADLTKLQAYIGRLSAPLQAQVGG